MLWNTAVQYHLKLLPVLLVNTRRLGLKHLICHRCDCRARVTWELHGLTLLLQATEAKDEDVELAAVDGSNVTEQLSDLDAHEDDMLKVRQPSSCQEDRG